MLFGSNKVYGATAIRVKKGDFLFLWNLDTDLLYGVFRAATDAKQNIIPEAWNGNYPYQVKVEPIGKIYPLKDSKKLLTTLNIGRSSPFGKSKTIKILELYRSEEMPIQQWFEFLAESKSTEKVEVSAESKSWQMFANVKNGKKE